MSQTNRKKMEMTIQRALSELKLISKKIESEMEGFYPVMITNKQGVVTYPENLNMSKEQAEKQIKSRWDCIMKLFENQRELKKAIVLSNATTTIVVAGKTMTIADAISMKDQHLQIAAVLTELKKREGQSMNAYRRWKELIHQKADEVAKAAFGREAAEIKGSDYEAVVKAYNERHEASVVDPINFTAEHESKIKWLMEFASEIDILLSESNAITKINVNI